MSSDSTVFLGVVVAYLAAVTAIGVWGYLQTRTEEDFLVAGRSIGPWVGGCVLAATQISAGTFVGTLGRHHLTGVSWIWIWFGAWRDVALGRRAVPRRHDVGDHVHRELDPDRHGGRVRARPLRPADQPAATERQLLLMNRLGIVVLGLVPVWFALQRFGDVQAIVVEQAKFIASFFFVPVVVGLSWRRGTKEGAVAAMAGGFAACLAWTLTLQRSFAAHGIDAVEVGVATSALLFVLVSRLTPPTPAANLAVFFDGGTDARRHHTPVL